MIKFFNDDPETHGIIMIGEIGGSAEEEAAEWIKKHCKKPVAGFIASTNLDDGPADAAAPPAAAPAAGGAA